MSNKILALGALASVICGQALAQQQPAFSQAAPPIVTGPRLILVDAIVSNEKGVVRDLTKEDFTVEDRGKKQNVILFDITESGKLKIPATPLPPGVISNRMNAKGETQATATVLLYDRINSDAQNQAFVRSQILRVLADLKPTDRLGFYSLGGNGLQIVSDYNEDAAPMAKAAKALLDSGTVPESFAPEEKFMFKALYDAMTPTQEFSNQARVNITYPAFRGIARHLTGVLGRKNLVWITSKFPLTYGNAQERRNDDQKEVNAFRNNLLESNIVLFPVDPGGTGASFNQNTSAPVANEGSLLPGRVNSGTGGPMGLSDTSQTGNQTMLMLADVTGGKAFRNANDIAPALKEVTSGAEYTYTFGFYPDAKTLDARNHDLKISVNKKGLGKVVVTHRKQYMAWGPESAAADKMIVPFDELVKDGMPATGVGLIAVANPDPANPGTQKVDMRITAGDLHFDQKGDQFTMNFDVAMIVEGGAGGAKTYNQAITKEQLAQVVAGGLTVQESIKTPGGNGVIRIALLDKSSGAAGSLRIPYSGPAAAPAPAPAK